MIVFRQLASRALFSPASFLEHENGEEEGHSGAFSTDGGRTREEHLHCQIAPVGDSVEREGEGEAEAREPAVVGSSRPDPAAIIDCIVHADAGVRHEAVDKSFRARCTWMFEKTHRMSMSCRSKARSCVKTWYCPGNWTAHPS